METRIKVCGEHLVEYYPLKAETKEELFMKLYKYFKSERYCTTVKRFEDKELEKDYCEWLDKNFQTIWRANASENDYY